MATQDDKKDSFEEIIAALNAMLAESPAEGAAINYAIDKEKLLADSARLLEYVPYLLLLWASFTVYQLEPEEGEGSGTATIIPLDSGRKIFDFGTSLSTSPGEDYGSYCVGKLIDSVKEMINIMANRGVTRVGFSGHEIAKRAAWIHCIENNIAVSDFEPTLADQKVRDRITHIRKETQRRVQEATSHPRPI